MASKLIELLAYENEVFENAQNKLEVRSIKKREDKSMKALLNELKWEGR